MTDLYHVPQAIFKLFIKKVKSSKHKTSSQSRLRYFYINFIFNFFFYFLHAICTILDNLTRCNKTQFLLWNIFQQEHITQTHVLNTQPNMSTTWSFPYHSNNTKPLNLLISNNHHPTHSKGLRLQVHTINSWNRS